MKPFDDDLLTMSVDQLRDEVIKARDLLRSAVSQIGDNLCWRDFFVAAGELLPVGDPLRPEAQASLSSLLPRAIHIGNCQRFIDSLKEGTEYIRPGEPFLTVATAKLKPARMIQLELQIHRNGSTVDAYVSTASFLPAQYSCSPKAREVAHDQLEHLLIAADRKERGY